MDSSKVTGGCDLGVPTAGDSNIGGGFIGDSSKCPEETEYGCTVHRNVADSRPLQGDGAEAWGMGC